MRLQVNGANTQGENVADAGGVHESYLAYAKTVEAEGAEDTLPGLDQTVEQLFFLAYAQVSANSWLGLDSHWKTFSCSVIHFLHIHNEFIINEYFQEYKIVSNQGRDIL